MYPRPEEFIGQEVDGHRIDAVLGRGGMGIVFKAENLELSRTVALKIINPALAQDDSFLRRFRAEARALAQIHHPNIVIVYDFRQFDMGFYISMEYVDGPTLADYLENKGPVPWKEGLYLTKQMLSAFHYAHSCGVIHRDIKPRNILMARNNVVKITDFGLAKILQEGKKNTDTTVTMTTGGTIHYMPPEQIRGLRNVDHRGDIFSLGMTIYEAIAGVLPFEKNASGYTIQKMIVEEPFPDIRKFDASVPKSLAKIIMKSLEKEPNKRFQTAAEMISALEEFELNQATTALAVNGTASSYAKPSSFGQRWKIYAALVGFLIVAGSFMAMFMPEKLSAFITGSSPDPPTLAEQLLERTNASTASNGSQGTPVSGMEPDPIDGSSSIINIDSLFGNQTATLNPDSAASIEPSDSNPFGPEATEIGSIRFDSNPEGAQIFLNGVSIGTTPLFLDNIESGTAEVEMRMSNHEVYKSVVEVRPFEVVRVNGQLNPIRGLLKLDINPVSELYVDGRLVEKEAGGDLRIPLLATSHEIMIANPTYGQWVKNVDILAGDSLEYSIDFTETVTFWVITHDTAENGMHAEVILDGKSTGLYAPTPVDVSVGLHLLEVKAEGYEMVEEAMEINFDASTESPIRFTLRKSG